MWPNLCKVHGETISFLNVDKMQKLERQICVSWMKCILGSIQGNLPVCLQIVLFLYAIRKLYWWLFSFQDCHIHVLSHFIETETQKICKICNKTLAKSTMHQDHLKIHSTISSFLCNVCGTTFNVSVSEKPMTNIEIKTKTWKQSVLSLYNVHLIAEKIKLRQPHGKAF